MLCEYWIWQNYVLADLMLAHANLGSDEESTRRSNLTDKEFRLTLIAYRRGEVDFLTLSPAQLGACVADVYYAPPGPSPFLAGGVALEQARGVPIPSEALP